MATTSTFDPAVFKQTTEEQWQRAADAWHRWHPLIQTWLGPATEVMLDAARIGPGSRVLDVAAGAGEPALTAAARVGPTGYILATDISSNILGFAARDAASRGFTQMETKVMDGENLTLDDAQFDAALSRVGLIYFPDRQRALTEIRRVLKPGGRLSVMVYSTPDRNGFFSIPVGIIRKAAGLGPPAPGQPGPFSLGSPGVLEETLQAAGFRDIELHTISAPVQVPTAAECVRFERESFGALHQMLAKLPEPEQNAVWEDVEAGLRQFEQAGRFSGPCEMLVAAGTN
jgi:ubiquinone/menaquinone biosynthesis C-methylase UbiE